MLKVQLFGQEVKIYSPDQLKEDLTFMKENIETYNPALGIFHSTENFENLYDSAFQAIDSSMSVLDFYPLLAMLLAETKEGHAYLGSSDDTTQYYIQGFLNNTFKFLPLNLKCLDGRVYVWANFTEENNLERGDEILSINGQSIDSILQTMKKFTSADGDIETARKRKIFSSFGGYYYWFIEKPENFTIVFKSENEGLIKTIKIPAKTRAEMVAIRNDKYGIPDKKEEEGVLRVFEKEFHKDHAYLSLKSFNKDLMKEFKINPKKLFKAFFKEIENRDIDHLIIDLRDNPGGRVEYVRSLTPFITKEYDRTIFYQTTSWKGKISKYKFPKQHKYNFKGDIIILTNAGSFSNGSVVAWYAQEYCDATVIGEETGSRAEGFAAGSRQRLKLPNTGISLNIPRYLFTYTTNRTIRNRGVIPDIAVEYTFRDLAEKKDPVLQKAHELIIRK
jgi:hypothetical protein